MSTNYEKLEREARQLGTREKAALARTLIEDLDGITDVDVEKLWIDEAQRRYENFQSGTFQAIPGEEAMQRARQRLK
ncbi:MAG: addiction module protein [Proteobacteria bacterium]|nr:addiction module protein [Pseudomonadota bacterium]